MRSKMQDVEENVIRAKLGDELFDDLKTKDTGTQNFSGKEKEFLKKLKKAIAYFTVAYAIPFLNIRIDANGITVASSQRTDNDDLSTRNAASADALTSVMKNSQQAAQNWMTSATKYLDDNKDDFTGWPVATVTSETIIHPVVSETCNRDAKGSFGLY